jgi:Rieske Fe-S protein
MALEASRHQTTDEAATRGGSSRRAVLRVAAVGGATVAVGLTAAACGTAWSLDTPIADQTASDDPAAANGIPIAETSDIPLEGGKVVADDGGTVITQPSAGTYNAFTAVCTHQGCTVGSVSDNQITCPCHGSIFSAKDGSVIQGPANAPLAAKPVIVSGDQIYLT